MHQPDELDALVGAVASEPDIAAQLAAAVATWRRPVRVQVTGRAAVGKSAVVAALDLPSDAETGPTDAANGDPEPVLDGDVVIYVLPGHVAPPDVRAIADAPASVVLAVLNKADTVSSRVRDVVDAVQSCTDAVGVPVLPLVATLALHTVSASSTESEIRLLRLLAARRDVTPTLSPDLLLGIRMDTDVQARRTMLQRGDMYGVTCAIAALRHDPSLDSAALGQLLHAASGLDALRSAVSKQIERAVALRGGALLDTMERLAARAAPGTDADSCTTIETFLRGDLAARIGLRAASACPDIADLAVPYPTVDPTGPQDALRRADHWRVVASTDISARGRRAARRLHHGYIRAWERMPHG